MLAECGYYFFYFQNDNFTSIFVGLYRLIDKIKIHNFINKLASMDES